MVRAIVPRPKTVSSHPRTLPQHIQMMAFALWPPPPNSVSLAASRRPGHPDGGVDHLDASLRRPFRDAGAVPAIHHPAGAAGLIRCGKLIQMGVGPIPLIAFDEGKFAGDSLCKVMSAARSRGPERPTLLPNMGPIFISATDISIT